MIREESRAYWTLIRFTPLLPKIHPPLSGFGTTKRRVFYAEVGHLAVSDRPDYFCALKKRADENAVCVDILNAPMLMRRFPFFNFPLLAMVSPLFIRQGWRLYQSARANSGAMRRYLKIRRHGD